MLFQVGTLSQGLTVRHKENLKNLDNQKIAKIVLKFEQCGFTME